MNSSAYLNAEELTTTPLFLQHKSTAQLVGKGTARWHLRLKEENRDKVIVFFAEANGIFHLGELAILLGMRLHRLSSSIGSPQAILQRYDISP